MSHRSLVSGFNYMSAFGSTHLCGLVRLRQLKMSEGKIVVVVKGWRMKCFVVDILHNKEQMCIRCLHMFVEQPRINVRIHVISFVY